MSYRIDSNNGYRIASFPSVLDIYGQQQAMRMPPARGWRIRGLLSVDNELSGLSVPARPPAGRAPPGRRTDADARLSELAEHRHPAGTLRVTAWQSVRRSLTGTWATVSLVH